MGRVVGLVALVAALIAGAFAAPAGAAKPPKPVLIYGDSLVFESFHPAANYLGAKYTAVPEAVIGSAPCDWLPGLQGALSTYHPAVVLVASAGNTQGPGSCETADLGSAPFLSDYQRDLTTFVQTVSASGAQLVFVEDPPFLYAPRDAVRPQINADMVALASQYPRVTIYTKAAKALATHKGGYEPYAKCLKGETIFQGCNGGMIAIRTVSGDGIGLHFCPDGLKNGHCDEYSSGEQRFGKYLAAGAKHPKPVNP